MTKSPIELAVNGLKLKGNLYTPQKSKNLAVLFLHGWTGLPNEQAAELLAKNGYPVMTFSLSGHNDSEGRIEDQTRQKSLDEVLAAYDLFKSKLPAEAKVGLVGNSYGGYLAAVLTAERRIAFLSMRVPANYPDEHFTDLQKGQGHENSRIMEWRDQAIPIDSNRALAAVHNFQGPAQIIEAGLDECVPHQTVQNYVDSIKDKTRLDYRYMKDWPHSLGLDKQRNEQFQQLLLNWLEETKLMTEA
jgi:esterase/lipase